MVSSVADINGEAVDWWFMYKLPANVGPKGNTTGFEYLYCDATDSVTAGPTLSKRTLEDDDGALAATLKQLFGDDRDVGYVLWNDEIPPTKEEPSPNDNGGKGHSKGILAFNKKADSAFYLLHSTPRFPAVGVIEMPDNEHQYGQTYLCMTLKDYATANAIAGVLRVQNETQVYASKLPGVDKTEEIAKLAADNNKPIPTKPATLNLTSKAGEKFVFMAKNERWSKPTKGSDGKDFWEDLVAPALNADLNVETWRRGKVFSDVDAESGHESLDVLDIDLGNIGLPDYKWAYTKDHAKWGISEKNPPGYVVVADINRQTSQGKRGGGGLAFKHKGIWKSLHTAEITEHEAQKEAHKDKA